MKRAVKRNDNNIPIGDVYLAPPFTFHLFLVCWDTRYRNGRGYYWQY